MTIETEQQGIFGRRDSKMDVRAGPVRFLVVVESVVASVVKDAALALLVIGIFLALDHAGATPGYIAGVMTVMGAIAFLTIVLRRTLKKAASVNPESALDYIEQELEEALAEAKRKGDRI